MKSFFSLVVFLFVGMKGFSQPLAFVEVGFDPAYCRVFSYQSGNAVVYAAASGGTAPLVYQWTNLGTGATTNNTVWGGLNVGEYEIKVTDDIGAVIMDTVVVDSLNPIANINIVSAGLTLVGDYYQGLAPITVEFENISLNCVNPNDPGADTTFFWRMSQWEPWYLVDAYDPNQTFDYDYAGVYGVKLVAINNNGCTDTALVRLNLAGPVGLEDKEIADFTVITNSSTHQLTVNSAAPVDGEQIRMYSLSGQLIMSAPLTSVQTIVHANCSAGVYLYEIIDAHAAVKMAGKVVFN